ncbi:ER-golgi trafficking TRAPP I complex 85 kDa subunit-domain-containing protein [Chytridium lagenaria]|nr:ER-golgi trafficking TRAPP I complex 85 kDa subunit-domain-containing protein [Chytridium lagenaria]
MQDRGKGFVVNCLSPCVAVLTSDDVGDVVSANGLNSAVEFFTPFGFRIEGKVHVRDGQGQSSSVDNFALRFADFNALEGIETDDLRRVLLEAMKESTPKQKLLFDEESLREASIEELSPWFTEYRNYVCKYIGATEHETFNHPVACLLISSTANPDPVEALSRLYPEEPASLPQAFQKGIIDAQIPLKHYLLIHDVAKSGPIDSEILYNQMKKKFGLGCHFLSINSVTDSDAPKERCPDIWSSYLHEQRLLQSGAPSVPQNNTVRGTKMTNSDVKAVDQFIREFLVRSILPHMERNVQHWNEQVANPRRGFTGRLFKRYLFGNQPAASPTSATEQASALDYKSAYSTYEIVRKEFQGNDRALKYYAGSQEMLALCLVMSESNIRGSLDTYLESAIGHYLDVNSPVLATRLTMFVYEIFKHRNQHRDAPNILLRMIGMYDSDLRSALLLEQAAFCFAKSSPSMLRKYAFYIILASYRFNKSSQPAHAFRCYNGAFELYKDKKWTLIEDHIQYSLGKLSSNLEKPADAISYFSSLLHSSQQPAHIQQAYINEFLGVYKECALSGSGSALDDVLSLPIPLIKESSIRVSLLESRRPIHVAVEDEVWDSMEKDLVDEMFSNAGGPKPPPRAVKNSKDGGKSICAVGEPVFVEFEMENPLQVTLQLSDLSLYAEFYENDIMSSSVIQTSIDVDRLVFENFDMECLTTVSLDPLERRIVQLKVFPKKEGEIRVKGLRYMLFGTVPNSVNLEKTRPKTLLSGQVERTVLEINNKGNRGLKKLMVKMSHPSFFSIGTPDQIDHSTYATMASLPNAIFNSSVNMIKLPDTTSGGGEELLQAGMTTIIPIWVRGDRIGKHIFRFLFLYKSEDENDQISYRKLQYTLTLQVFPSLRINAFTRPSTRALDEFILGVEIENLQQSSPIKLRQISAIGSAWRITAMNGSSSDYQTEFLAGKQTAFAYFRFKRVSASDSDYASEKTITSAIKSFIYGNEGVEFNPNTIALQASSVSLDGGAIDCRSSTLKTLSLNSRVQWRRHALSSQYPGISPEKLKSLFTLYFTDDVDIALFWEAPASGNATSRLGHHYIIGINLGLQSPLQLHTRFAKSANAILANQKSLYAATLREKKELLNSLLRPKQKDVSPVRFLLSSLDYFVHDFNKGMLQICITSKLHNTSWNNVVSYFLEMQSPDLKSTQEDMFLDYFWSGPVQAHGVLEPGEQRELKFFANFTRSGTFDLNRWKLSIVVLENDENSSIKTIFSKPESSSSSYVQYPSVQHLVNVRNK